MRKSAQVIALRPGKYDDSNEVTLLLRNVTDEEWERVKVAYSTGATVAVLEVPDR